ncbi:mcmbp [Symbiodinium necroappetens]|uniref:Mcmbp protein n=1 Tax=Symbiodinium necroappetens TaxID=1628268 RepID=A0A812Q1Q4_9DINO|nr:mcmbp [Symbiodinium necroappetens]|mmetsp:Transcript_1739/g.4026  ORF Transcript_1739/g.4026 Transcript_1739/m.4026 type:complete len:617 (-) Transcript_1739:164-2014(-)|eukprot:CAMPEP_0181429068 /NCGR_PEP_ID=MMETSP1110-20121109/17009_1 /TAXON_ID=174948 /ORGANISM="Symbiodinium sp., Strain CCMP421" /LENGTH=616 /DNA_ID=CAMNT_0023552325 /DNA_START=44 /DNA_END=1894 /DNA_ORIENTATION=+
MCTAMREIYNPLGVIDDLFAVRTKGSTLDPPHEWGEKAHFLQALRLDEEDNFSKIPCLNDVELVESLPPFSLVRYRCMVQDIFDPEMYAAFCVTKTEGDLRLVNLKYRERLPVGDLEDVGNAALRMRGAYYCVPLPGETSWANQPTQSMHSGAHCPEATLASGMGLKRRRDADINMENVDAQAESHECPECPTALPSSARARHNSAPAASPGQNADSFGLNFPLPWEETDRRKTPCIVKLYDEDEEALSKLGETVEVLGILCVDPAMANLGEVWSPAGADARDPSTALVPRLHGLLVRKLQSYHPMFPFTASWLSEERLSLAFQGRLGGPGAVVAARATAVALLQKSLGDSVAAEYVLAMLISRAHDAGLGQWSLNLTHLDPSQGTVSNLFRAIQELMPRAVCLPLTTELLNSGGWRPRKDFEANRLRAGKLQLSAGTVLVLDETQLDEGHLNAEGVASFGAVQNIVSKQTLPCDFSVCTMEIPLEINSLVTSRGCSVLKVDAVMLPLCKDADITNCQESSNLDASRFFLGLITRHTQQLRIPEDVAHTMSGDYAKMRNKFLEIGQSTLCRWVSLARSICLSHGEEELSLSRWQSILELEKQRLQRCVDAGFIHLR